MTQIILESRVYLPRRSRDQYSCWEDVLATTLTMISGRQVTELANNGKGYKVWKVSCTYDALPEKIYLESLEILRSGKAFTATVLPDNSRDMVTARFMVESMTPASFAFEDSGRPVWHGLSFTLREVAPHA